VAVVTLNTLLEDYPDDVPAWLEHGRIYLALGQTNPKFLRQAQEIANKILTIDAQNVKALALSGNVSTALKDYGSATDPYEKAAKIGPAAAEAVVGLNRSKALQKN
jgi:tetratricopeptide (TPR) repeat protein